MLAAALAAGLVFSSLIGCSAGSGNGETGETENAEQGGAGSGEAAGGQDKQESPESGAEDAGPDGKDGASNASDTREYEGLRPVEEDGDVFRTLGARPGDLACGGYTVTAEDGTVYAANISGSGTITRISPDGTETVICDVEPWDNKKKVTDLNLRNGVLYFEIGPVINYTLYHAYYLYPVNGIYRLDLAAADEYLKHYDKKEKGYEDLPEPVSVIQNEGAMGASYAVAAYYDPLIRGGKLYYWVNNDYRKGRQLYRADLNGKNAEMIYDSADRKVVSWTADDEYIYISDDLAIFSLSDAGTVKKLAAQSGSCLQRYGEALYFADGGNVCRLYPDDPSGVETVLERDGTLNGFNVSGGKIYFLEELGEGTLSSYIGEASGFGPEGYTDDGIRYVKMYMGDPEFSKYGNTYLKGPCLAAGMIWYIESYKDAEGKEYGDVCYAALDPGTKEFRESRTGPE